MALSKKVTESLEESKSAIRNALWYAAKNEKPVVNKQIADILLAIDNISNNERMQDKLEDMMNDWSEE